MIHPGRPTAVAIAFAAILLRALLPAGWMPNPDGASVSPLVVCTMDGPGRMMPDDHMMSGAKPDMDRHHDQKGRHDNPVCPFAAAPHLAPPAIAAALSSPSALAGTVLRAAWIDVAGPAGRHSPQSPRAPPAPV